MDLMADFKLREQDDGTVSMSLASLSPGLMRGGRLGTRVQGPELRVCLRAAITREDNS